MHEALLIGAGGDSLSMSILVALSRTYLAVGIESGGDAIDHVDENLVLVASA